MVDLSLFDLTGKNALVTGGVMGLGRAMAVALATAGAILASAASNFVTGHNLVVDGGHTVNTWFKPFTPLTRTIPPRVDARAELAETLIDRQALNIQYPRDVEP